MATLTPIVLPVLYGPELVDDWDMSYVDMTYWPWDTDDLTGGDAAKTGGWAEMICGLTFSVWMSQSSVMEVGKRYLVQAHAVESGGMGQDPYWNMGGTAVGGSWDFDRIIVAANSQVYFSMYASGFFGQAAVDYISVREIIAGFMPMYKDDADSLELYGMDMEGDLTFTGGAKITGLNLTPINDYDVASKKYADDAGVHFSYLHPPVKAFASQQRAVTGTTSLAFQGRTLVAGDRALLVGQTDQKENGIWIVGASGYTRPTDFAAGFNAGNCMVLSTGQTGVGGGYFRCVNINGSGDVVGTNNLIFTPMREGTNKMFASASTGSPPSSSDYMSQEMFVWNIGSGTSCRIVAKLPINGLVYTEMTEV
jgi:hypothetical protein